MHRSSVSMLALSLLLSGCVSGLHSSQSAPQQFLLSLNAPPAPAAPVSREPTATLQVLQPLAAAGLGSTGIAVLRPGQRLDYYNGARWAQAAPNMLQALLIEALRRRDAFGLVQSDTGAFQARYLLSVEVTRFDAQYGAEGTPPTIHVSLLCTLGQGADRSAITTLTVNSTVSAAADRMQQVIAAFEQATNQALWRVADELTPPASAPAGP